MLLHWQFLGSKIIVNLKKCYFTIHCEEEEVLCLISCRRSGVGGGGAWFKERQFWQKYVHKGKKSFWCLATCHSKVGLKSSALHREKKTSQKVSTIFPFWNTSPKLRFLHWNSYLTKCKCRPTDTRIFLLHIRNRQNLTIFFSICTIWSTLDICWSPSKKLKVKKVDLILLEYKNVTFLIFTLFKNPQKSTI